jgi:hypothetical protein
MSTQPDDIVSEDDPEVRAAVEAIGRAVAQFVQAKLGDPHELVQTDLGHDLQTGRACITAAIIWPDMSMMFKLCIKGQEPMELLEVSLPRVKLQ